MLDDAWGVTRPGRPRQKEMMTMSQPLITSDDPKENHAVELFRVAYRRCGLSPAAQQQLNERGGEFQGRIIEVIQDLTFVSPSEPTYAYPEGYRGVRPIEEQIERIQELFPGASWLYDRSLARRPCPEGMEGYFAFPCWRFIAHTYLDAVLIALEKLEATRSIEVYIRDRLTKERYAQCERSKCAWEEIEARQTNRSLYLLPAQFGLRYQGRSVLEATAGFVPGEFGLGLFETIIMLLTHPDRLSRYTDLGIYSAGDEIRHQDDGERCIVPFIQSSNIALELLSRLHGTKTARTGSVSAMIW